MNTDNVLDKNNTKDNDDSFEPSLYFIIICITIMIIIIVFIKSLINLNKEENIMGIHYRNTYKDETRVDSNTYNTTYNNTCNTIRICK